MSRQMHLVEVTEKQLHRFHKSRLAAAAVVLVFFSAFMIFAPEVDPKTTVPEVTAAVSGGTE
jgi:hypothetical protein